MSNLRRNSGFTLIEIIVVVAIVGILVTIVTLGLRDNSDRDARLQAQRFIAVVDRVRDEAIISGGYFAMSVDERENQVVFEALHEATSDQGDDFLKTRGIKKGIDLRFDILDRLPTAEDELPRIVISALGEITPFELSFGGNRTEYVIFIDDEGQIQMREQNARRF